MMNRKEIKEYQGLLTLFSENNTYVLGASNPRKEIRSSIELV